MTHWRYQHLTIRFVSRGLQQTSIASACTLKSIGNFSSVALLGCREVGTKNHQWGSTNGSLCNKCRLVSGTPQLIPIECGVVSRFSDRFPIRSLEEVVPIIHHLAAISPATELQH
jgi:hypothetical protein